MNRLQHRPTLVQVITTAIAAALQWLAALLRSWIVPFKIVIPSATTASLVRASATDPTKGTVCAQGHTVGDNGTEGPNQVYARIYLPTDTVPSSPIDPGTSALYPGVVSGKVNTPNVGDWRFIREPGGSNNEIPNAVCAPAPTANNNRLGVWCLFSTGWRVETIAFQGITSNTTSCESGSGSGSGGGGGPAHVGECGPEAVGATIRVGDPALTAGAGPGPRVEEPGRVRHLLYHVFPLSEQDGAVWRWNVAQLRRRIGLFNGRRVIAVAVGPETDSAGEVRDALAGCGCEFIETDNDPALKEVVTFPRLLEAVANLRGPEHATFYGHAKGVTSQAWAPGARPWTEAMYEACLDHWPQVRRLLVDHPLVGPFKRNFCGFPGSRAAWYYAGSFRWMRNADLFARNWREIDPAWTGTESHPGLHFAPAEGACLLGETTGTGPALYHKESWDAWAADAVTAWRERHHDDRWQPLLLTCILTSHRKPRFVHEAIASVLAQSTPDWQLVIIDSGPLLEAGEFRRYAGDPRIVIVPSGETADMRGRVGLQARAINEATRRGLVRGDLVCYLCDDDIYYRGAFAAFLAAARSAPWESAWYGPADHTELRRDGREVALGRLRADGRGGIGGVELDCRADGMQVCHRRDLLPRVPWPEEVDDWWHCDGLFLESLGRITPIHPIAATVGRHRHTADSTFTQSSDAGAVRQDCGCAAAR